MLLKPKDSILNLEPFKLERKPRQRGLGLGRLGGTRLWRPERSGPVQAVVIGAQAHPPPLQHQRIDLSGATNQGRETELKSKRFPPGNQFTLWIFESDP